MESKSLVKQAIRILARGNLKIGRRAHTFSLPAGGTCPDCHYPTDRRFLSCPQCLRKLREPCVRCGEPLDPRWKICPYCETVAPGFPTEPVDRLTG